MGKYFVEITPDAKKDLKEHFKSGNKSIIKKIEKILLELAETPYDGKENQNSLSTIFMVIGQDA
jgi:toxin YoeB